MNESRRSRKIFQVKEILLMMELLGVSSIAGMPA